VQRKKERKKEGVGGVQKAPKSSKEKKKTETTLKKQPISWLHISINKQTNQPFLLYF
jgi:ribosomal protein L44E